jgi:ankyrin repeat protein
LVNQPNALGLTPLHLAVRLGDLSVVWYLLSRPHVDLCTFAADLSTFVFVVWMVWMVWVLSE